MAQASKSLHSEIGVIAHLTTIGGNAKNACGNLWEIIGNKPFRKIAIKNLRTDQPESALTPFSPYTPLLPPTPCREEDRHPSETRGRSFTVATRGSGIHLRQMAIPLDHPPWCRHPSETNGRPRFPLPPPPLSLMCVVRIGERKRIQYRIDQFVIIIAIKNGFNRLRRSISMTKRR